MSNFPAKPSRLTGILRRLWQEAREAKYPQEIRLEHGLTVRVCAGETLEIVLMRDPNSKPSLDEIKAVANAAHWAEFETTEGLISKGRRVGTPYYHMKEAQPLM